MSLHLLPHLPHPSNHTVHLRVHLVRLQVRRIHPQKACSLIQDLRLMPQEGVYLHLMLPRYHYFFYFHHEAEADIFLILEDFSAET